MTSVSTGTLRAQSATRDATSVVIDGRSYPLKLFKGSSPTGPLAEVNVVLNPGVGFAHTIVGLFWGVTDAGSSRLDIRSGVGPGVVYQGHLPAGPSSFYAPVGTMRTDLAENTAIRVSNVGVGGDGLELVIYYITRAV